jgi:hypothetical protein
MVSATVVIATVDTGVFNAPLAGGATMADLIAQAAAGGQSTKSQKSVKREKSSKSRKNSMKR